MKSITDQLASLVNVADAARRLKISTVRVHQFIQDGRLPSEMVGRMRFIRPADLRKFAAVKRKIGKPTGGGK